MTQRSPVAAPIQRKKVMLVNSDLVDLAVSRYALESAGYAVRVHSSPVGCIAAILREAPDVLLIDVNMQDLNGPALLRTLATTKTCAKMIVLLHSNLPESVLALMVTKFRVHGYIRDTEGAQALVRRVAHWVRPVFGSGIYDLDLDASAAPRPTHAVTSKTSTYRILLADSEMVALSNLRRLLLTQSGPIEFALSGHEVLRRLQGIQPPDVVVLGTLTGALDEYEVLANAIRLDPRWESRFIVLQEASLEERPRRHSAIRLLCPVTEDALGEAIQHCVRHASHDQDALR
jgi:CheY-like chemotaxis protein